MDHEGNAAFNGGDQDMQPLPATPCHRRRRRYRSDTGVRFDSLFLPHAPEPEGMDSTSGHLLTLNLARIAGIPAGAQQKEWDMRRSLSFWICFLFMTGWFFLACLWTADLSLAKPIHETRAVFNDEAGNRADADDPAIWVNAANPRQSLVIGTLKRGGIDVYDLKGALLQHILADTMPPDMELRSARYNNVDIVYGLKIGDGYVDLAVVTDRHNDLLRFFAIDPASVAEGSAPLKEITAPGAPLIFSATRDELSTGNTAYGLAVTQSDPRRGTAHAFVSRSGRTTIARATVFPDNGRITYNVAEQFDLPDHLPLPNGKTWHPCLSVDGDAPHVEGMVVDDFHKVLYLAQERVGIWKIPIDEEPHRPVLVDRVKAFGVPFERIVRPDGKKFSCELKWQEDPKLGSDHLTADVEGLTIYDMGDGRGYLLASSQGASEFVVYDRLNGAYIGKFDIAGGVIDGSEECDGAHVVSAYLSSELAGGLLVVHDGVNTPETTDRNGTARDSTNFKFVRWADVAKALGLSVRKHF